MAGLSHTKLDQELFERFYKLPIFPFFKLIKPDPQDTKVQKQEFLLSGKNPVFSYTRAMDFDIENYLKELEECKTDIGKMETEDWIRDLYIAKLSELKTRANMIVAIKASDDRTVEKIARELFGTHQCDKTELENELSRMISPSSNFKAKQKPINAEMFAQQVQTVLDYYEMQNWKIKFTDQPNVKLSRGRSKNTATIWIPRKFKASHGRAKRLLIHEIEIHALRTQNGMNSPLHILRIGLDSYIETDEGLALYFQMKQGDKPRQFDSGFWGSYACALTQEHDFNQTFQKLLKARMALDKLVGRSVTKEEQQSRVWKLCMRAYRGITNPNKPGLGTCKDHIYRSGLEKIRKTDIENPDVQKLLFAGNIGLHHLDTIKHLDLSYVKTPDLISK
ncbi:DUF1704 domain-containing protein [Candidatus Uhrbacteria bacterium]|jgi:hypothetical protein|nr:DUF1704 domain-containing protein [Candidatus Uhrbacteria bacterium]MBT7717563.1 DUF1704 domain-containing protein [Candidatus Uhrbacteria bacterium]